MILSHDYARLSIEDRKTGKEIASIEGDQITTINSNIVVRLKPSQYAPGSPKNHKYRIETDGEHTEVCIDDKPIPYICSITFSHDAGRKPKLSIDLIGYRRITLDDDCNKLFSQETERRQ